MDRPRSPSERFYASRANSSTTQWDVPPHPVPEHDLRPHYVPPFGLFQGFSAPPSAHHNMSSQYATHGWHVPDDGWISPRMPIPNFSLFRDLPQQRLEELSDDTEDVPQPRCQPGQHRVSGIAATTGLHCGPARPWAGQLAGSSTQISPPPEYSSTPEYIPVPAFAEGAVPVMLPARGARALPLPHSSAVIPQTYKVPFEGEEESDASIKGVSSETAYSAAVAGNLDEVPFISSDNDGNSTVYPDDSVSGSSLATLSSLSDSGSFFPDATGHLEEGVAEVHDVCLAATQRYLEALRVNWELRHGRGVAVPLGGGPARRRRDRAWERGSPYARAGPWRRAVSENGGLDYIRGFGFGSHDHDHDDPIVDVADDNESRDSHIPRPTDSLLQNTTYICDLIWRRSLRDRGDVLGAEICGCRDMGFLFECAETVVLYDAGEWERDPERGFEMICQAGRNLCRDLKDVEGMERVNDIAAGRA